MLRRRAKVHPPGQIGRLRLNTSSTTSETAGRGNGSGRYPVLAQLPDVSDQLASVSPRSNRAAAAGFVSYRFDPPENADRGTDRRREMAESAGLATQPHIMQRPTTARNRKESPILPRSNPFAIPAASVEDTLAPVARFLFLFALFTAIGTAILTISRRAEPINDVAEPATAAAQQSLEPQMLKPQSNLLEAPTAPPTAAGPLGTPAPRTGFRIKPDERPAIQSPQSAVAPDASALHTADASGEVVPQVRTSDGPRAGVEDDPTRWEGSAAPPAVARLSGTILAAPTQQAHHDDNQSSLH